MLSRPWMLITRSFWYDLPFFGTIGLLCGLTQWAGHHLIDDFKWGTELFQELYSFQILQLSLLFLLLAKAWLRWRGTTGICTWLQACVSHAEPRAASLATTGAAGLLGVALAAALSASFREAIIFLGASIYLLALGEFAANPFFGPNRSKTYELAFGIMVGTPFGVSLAG